MPAAALSLHDDAAADDVAADAMLSAAAFDDAAPRYFHMPLRADYVRHAIDAEDDAASCRCCRH